MNKKTLMIIYFAILLIILMWSPWITKNYAEKIVSDKFVAEWEHVSDGCSLNGVKNSHRALFGYSVQIEYNCGLVLPNSPNKTSYVFVSFLSTVHGLPKI